MLRIWVVLLLAVAAHEGAHFLLLHRLAARPRPTIGILGPGWEFESGHLNDRQLRLVWAAGPIAEPLVWGTAAAIARRSAGPLLTLLLVQLLANTLLPGSDGWKLAQPQGDRHSRLLARRGGRQRRGGNPRPPRVNPA